MLSIFLKIKMYCGVMPSNHILSALAYYLTWEQIIWYNLKSFIKNIEFLLSLIIDFLFKILSIFPMDIHTFLSNKNSTQGFRWFRITFRATRLCFRKISTTSLIGKFLFQRLCYNPPLRTSTFLRLLLRYDKALWVTLIYIAIIL